MSNSRGLSSTVDPVIRPGRMPSASRMEMSDRLVRNIVGVGATRVSYRNGKIVIAGGSAVPHPTRAFIAGNWTTGLGTKTWIRCFLDSGTAVDHDGPAPNPFPPNEEWYEVEFTFGDIHIPRA